MTKPASPILFTGLPESGWEVLAAGFCDLPRDERDRIAGSFGELASEEEHSKGMEALGTWCASGHSRAISGDEFLPHSKSLLEQFADLHVVLFLEKPAAWCLRQALKNPPSSWETALSRWMQLVNPLLPVIFAHRSRVTVLETGEARAFPEKLGETLAANIGIAFRPSPAAGEPAGDGLLQAVGECCLAPHVDARSAAMEIEALCQPLDESPLLQKSGRFAEEVFHEFAALVAMASAGAISRDTSESEAAGLKEKNRHLLLQLFQTQEELEKQLVEKQPTAPEPSGKENAAANNANEEDPRLREAEEKYRHLLLQLFQTQEELESLLLAERSSGASVSEMAGRLKLAEEENSLLLQQLHQVQEELERYFLRWRESDKQRRVLPWSSQTIHARQVKLVHTELAPPHRHWVFQIEHAVFGEKTFDVIELRLAEHHGVAGLVLMKSWEEGPAPISCWQPDGVEDGRELMLLFSSNPEFRRKLLLAGPEDLAVVRALCGFLEEFFQSTGSQARMLESCDPAQIAEWKALADRVYEEFSTGCFHATPGSPAGGAGPASEKLPFLQAVHPEFPHRHLAFLFPAIGIRGVPYPELEVRLADHHGNPGLVLMRPPSTELPAPLYFWEPDGNEDGREYMLLFPSSENCRNKLRAANAQDILLLRKISTAFARSLKSGDVLLGTDRLTPEDLAFWAWTEDRWFSAFEATSGFLHYDDVGGRFLSGDGTTVEIEVENLLAGTRHLPSLKFTWLAGEPTAGGASAKMEFSLPENHIPGFESWRMDARGVPAPTWNPGLFEHQADPGWIERWKRHPAPDRELLLALLAELPNFLYHVHRKNPGNQPPLALLQEIAARQRLFLENRLLPPRKSLFAKLRFWK